MTDILYFDYCATTPVDAEVLKAMLPLLGEQFGNPSSMHQPGRHARTLMEKARTFTAEGLGAEPGEVLFTSGATESTNLALRGAMHALAPKKTHLIISAVEHHATLHTARSLEDEGFELTILPVDQDGLVSLHDVRQAVQPKTGLISIMMVNNEVGSVQDTAGIGVLAREMGVLFHTDVVQAVNCFDVNVNKLNADLVSISAHKIYGPKGVGALYIRSGVEILPELTGGSQEHRLRAGTENVSGIVGLGKAMELRNHSFPKRFERMSILREKFLTGLLSQIPECVINGPRDAAPHIISVSFPDVSGEMLLFHLDQVGVAASMGSACTSESIEPSHVLLAMGLSADGIEGTLRISMGEPTTSDDIERLLDLLPDAVENSRV